MQELNFRFIEQLPFTSQSDSQQRIPDLPSRQVIDVDKLAISEGQELSTIREQLQNSPILMVVLPGEDNPDPQDDSDPFELFPKKPESPDHEITIDEGIAAFIDALFGFAIGAYRAIKNAFKEPNAPEEEIRNRSGIMFLGSTRTGSPSFHMLLPTQGASRFTQQLAALPKFASGIPNHEDKAQEISLISNPLRV